MMPNWYLVNSLTNKISKADHMEKKPDDIEDAELQLVGPLPHSTWGQDQIYVSGAVRQQH